MVFDFIQADGIERFRYQPLQPGNGRIFIRTSGHNATRFFFLFFFSFFLFYFYSFFYSFFVLFFFFFKIFFFIIVGKEEASEVRNFF